MERLARIVFHVTFYCIRGDEHPEVDRLLREACASKSVTFVQLRPDEFDYDRAPDLRGQLLYRVATTTRARCVEKFLLRDGVASFYRTPLDGVAKLNHVIEATLQHQRCGVAIPKTVYGLSRNHEVLAREVESLGGFPVVLKAIGGTHGVGVMKVDSLSSLISLVDFLFARDPDPPFLLRSYILSTSSARLIVLGGEVVDSIEYLVPSGDFRSNVGSSPAVRSTVFPKDVQQLAVRAVEVLGWEFGGVDVVVHAETGQPFVTEVNLPCYFPRCQLQTGTDIAGRMVDYLLTKAGAMVRGRC